MACLGKWEVEAIGKKIREVNNFVRKRIWDTMGQPSLNETQSWRQIVFSSITDGHLMSSWLLKSSHLIQNWTTSLHNFRVFFSAQTLSHVSLASSVLVNLLLALVHSQPLFLLTICFLDSSVCKCIMSLWTVNLVDVLKNLPSFNVHDYMIHLQTLEPQDENFKR
jgi:hypothetical protein